MEVVLLNKVNSKLPETSARIDKKMSSPEDNYDRPALEINRANTACASDILRETPV